MDEQIEQEVIEPITQVVEVEAEPKTEVKPVEVETVEETIAKAKAELEAKAEAESEESKPEVKEVESKPEQRLEAKPSKQVKDKEVYSPPQDWGAEAKEDFRKLPKVAQKEIARVASQYERYRKQTINEFTEKERALKDKEEFLEPITKTVKNFMKVWGRQGLTVEAATAEICAFYADLLEDPDAAIEDVARKVGRKVQIEGKKAKPEQDPILREALERVSNLERIANSSVEAVQEQSRGQLVNDIDSALESLKEKVNSQEKYMYPDLHNPDFIQNDLEPLVIGLAKAKPNLSWEENIKRSYLAAGGRLLPNAAPTTTKLNGNRAARAATSIAGIGSSSSPGEIEFIPNESVEDTVRRTLAHMRSR